MATTLSDRARAREAWRPTWRRQRASKRALRRQVQDALNANVIGLTDAACLKVLGKVLPYKRKAGPYLGPYAQSTTDQSGKKRKRKARGKAMIQAKQANRITPEKIRSRPGGGGGPVRAGDPSK